MTCLPSLAVCVPNFLVIFPFKGGKKIVEKKWKKVKDCVTHEEYVLEIGADYPPILKRLWLWAKNALAEGKVSTFLLSDEAFGSTNKKAIFLSDVHALCAGDEISGSIISMYMK